MAVMFFSSKFFCSIFFALVIGVLTQSVTADDLADPPWFREVLNTYIEKHPLPALGASVVIDGKVVAASVVGVRKFGEDTPAQQNDRFHIGSITKPITVTMLARYIEQGFFNWSDTLEKMFPDLLKEMQADYRRVNIEQLVSHTSGMPYQPHIPEHETDKYGKTLQLKRKGYVVAALKDPPQAQPGTKYIYGGGHILAASYAENFMGLSYEELMREEVFIPLSMTTARFGPPATPNKLDAPWEHTIENGRIKPQAPNYDQFKQARSPVGRNLCMSVADLGRIAAVHLLGAQGKSDYLKKETFKYLHTPIPPTNAGPSWGIGYVDWARGKILWHGGSTLRNLAKCHIVPEENFALCIATNIWYEGIDPVFDRLNREIVSLVQQGRFGN